MHGIQSQAIKMVVEEPLARVLHVVVAHFITAGCIKVDGFAPGRAVASVEVGRVAAEYVAFRSHVIEHDIEQDGQPFRVAGINQFQQVLSPNADDAGVWIHQDAWFHIGKFDAGKNTGYTVKRKGNGVYAFIIEGSATIQGQQLNKRDALGVWDTDTLHIEVGPQGAEILLQDVPMQLS